VVPGHDGGKRFRRGLIVLSLLTPAQQPTSICAWRTHLRTVSAHPTPSLAATDVIAAHSGLHLSKLPIL